MWDFKLLSATQTLEKTMAYVIYRLGMYLLLSLTLVFGMVAGTGTGLILDSMFTTPGFFVRITGFVGILIFALVLYWFRSNWFFSIRAPHVALLGESTLQPGWARVTEARALIRKRFSTPRQLQTLNVRIRAVMADLFRQNTRLGQMLGKLDNNPLSRLLIKIVEVPASYAFEIIVAECLKDQSRSASGVAASALCLYAQNHERLFTNQCIIFALKGLAWFAVFLLMLTPVGWVDEIIPAEFGLWTYLFALLFSWPIKSALFDPIAIAAMMGVYSELTHTQIVDPHTQSDLIERSAEFASLKKQAEFLEKA